MTLPFGWFSESRRAKYYVPVMWWVVVYEVRYAYEGGGVVWVDWCVEGCSMWCLMVVVGVVFFWFFLGRVVTGLWIFVAAVGGSWPLGESCFGWICPTNIVVCLGWWKWYVHVWSNMVASICGLCSVDIFAMIAFFGG